MQHQGKLALVKPALKFAESYVAMVREFMEANEGWFTNFSLALEDFAGFVHELEDEAQGIALPPGIAPQQTYWLIQAGVMVLGEIRLRPHLTPPFEQHNGHIGYTIRPSQRGHGYATRQLALVLDKAREQGLARVMLTIKGENLPSVRVIEKNGGKLEWQRIVSKVGKTLSCYWIEL